MGKKILCIDVNTPVMNGFECVAALKALPRFAKILRMILP
jgi:CheY-like chemotaxis protein